MFNPLNTYVYSAVFLDKNGNYLTEEIIYVKKLDKKWEYQNNQKIIAINYQPDTIGLKNFINPVKKYRNKKFKNFISYEETGFIENDTLIWMHPFRVNQYIYTEIAPFPCLEFENGEIKKKWSSNSFIFFGWSSFKGIKRSIYSLQNISSYIFDTNKLEECYFINSEANHSKLGKSYLNIVYNKKIGFLEMNYIFYDNTVINIKLIEIK